MRLAVTAWRVLTVSEFLTELDTISSSRSRFENFRDFVETAYGGLASEVHGNREYEAAMQKRFQAILEKYGEARHEALYCMWGLFSRLVMTMLQYDGDFLGDVYRAARFPTREGSPIVFPYRAACRVANEHMDAQELESLGRDGRYVMIIQDHQSGTGSLMLACARRAQSLGFRPSESILVIAPDTDALCMQMTYLQAAVHQIPAICLHVDTVKRLVCEKASTPETFAVLGRMPQFPIHLEFAQGERPEVPATAQSEASDSNAETRTSSLEELRSAALREEADATPVERLEKDSPGPSSG